MILTLISISIKLSFKIELIIGFLVVGYAVANLAENIIRVNLII
jgi:hypothetical protein